MPESQETVLTPRSCEEKESLSQGAFPENRFSRHDKNSHLNANHLLKSLKTRAISGGIVTVSSQTAKFCVTLVSTMILSRLIPPKDVGLVAMALVVMDFVRVFKDGGLSTA